MYPFYLDSYQSIRGIQSLVTEKQRDGTIDVRLENQLDYAHTGGLPRSSSPALSGLAPNDHMLSPMSNIRGELTR